MENNNNNMNGDDGKYAVELIESLQKIIPEIIRDRDVCKMTVEDLQTELKPVRDMLIKVNPEKLLQTNIVERGSGAPIGNVANLSAQFMMQSNPLRKEFDICI